LALPLAGETVSQVPPVAVLALAVKLVDPLAVSWRLWVTAEPAAVALIVSDTGLAAMAVPPVTWSTTGTVTGIPPTPTGVKTMSVRYMPDVRLTGFKVRLTFTGVVRLTPVLVTCNQEAGGADMVNSCCGRSFVFTLRYASGGAGLPLV
jgi:hypothetical protein